MVGGGGWEVVMVVVVWRGEGGGDERASLGQDSRLGYKRGMKIEFLPASASTLTRGPCVRLHGIWKLNGGCDFSWGLPGLNQPRQSGPCDVKPHGG